MKQLVKQIIKQFFSRCGYQLVPRGPEFPVDFGPEDIAIIKAVYPYTMTSPERILALIQAVSYVVRYHIPGDIVECGVWRGGSIMAAALTLMRLNQSNKDFYLFDTFAGTVKPGPLDVAFDGAQATEEFERQRITDDSSNWSNASLEEVKAAVFSTGYNQERFHFITGRVEDTIPSQAPASISILRLDTDWYKSTRHELTHLFPRLSRGAVLIIDDYGHYQGARQACDEYFSEQNICLLLNRIDYTGRIAVKLGD
jgi:O-methyltransferase